jgi:hypothetical protein
MLNNLTRIRDREWLVVEPALRLNCIFIKDFVRSLLIPIVGLHRQSSVRRRTKKVKTSLLRLRISNLLFINPVRRFRILRVVNFLRWVDWRLEILEKGTFRLAITVKENLVRVVGTVVYLRNHSQIETPDILNDECVKIGQLLNSRLGGGRQMLFLKFTGLGVLVTEDEMDLRAT